MVDDQAVQSAELARAEFAGQVLHAAGVLKSLVDGPGAGGVVGEIRGEEPDAVWVLELQVEELVRDGAADEEDTVGGREGEKVSRDGEADACEGWGVRKGFSVDRKCVRCGII